jgi:NAD(P)-dependent dehydrogenase (short-subunit alcohol dehydrogenase family)
LGKLGQPKYFAEEVVGVARNPYLTGTVIRVDGGLVLGHL